MDSEVFEKPRSFPCQPRNRVSFLNIVKCKLNLYLYTKIHSIIVNCNILSTEEVNQKTL